MTKYTTQNTTQDTTLGAPSVPLSNLQYTDDTLCRYKKNK